MEAIAQFESVIRIGFFVGILALMAVLETVAPRRKRRYWRRHRWPANLLLVVINSALGRLILPLPPILVALLASERQWGLFNLADLPPGLAVIIAVLAMDLAIYLQHVMFHAVPALWRLHRLHHADLDFDVTTGTRFHPIEIVLSLTLKSALILLIGAPVLAVLIFEILLNATAMFNHANFRLPDSADRIVRLFLVTPDMHRVHHSIRAEETHRNFGFNLPWWDRLLGTYKDQPADGHEEMTIGLPEFRNPLELRFVNMLTQPFRSAGLDREATPPERET